MFTITKKFVSGILKGVTIEERTSVKFEEGRTYQCCAGGSAYKVLKVTKN